MFSYHPRCTKIRYGLVDKLTQQSYLMLSTKMYDTGSHHRQYTTRVPWCEGSSTAVLCSVGWPRVARETHPLPALSHPAYPLSGPCRLHFRRNRLLLKTATPTIVVATVFAHDSSPVRSGSHKPSWEASIRWPIALPRLMGWLVVSWRHGARWQGIWQGGSGFRRVGDSSGDRPPPLCFHR